MADQVVDTIQSTAKTDKIGDGKIFVLDVAKRRARADRRNQRRRALSAPFHEKDHSLMDKKYLLPLAAVATAALLPTMGFAPGGRGSARGHRRSRMDLQHAAVPDRRLPRVLHGRRLSMLEGGLVRSKNVTMQMTKNVGCSPSRRSCTG
jgi:hypothetical protein